MKDPLLLFEIINEGKLRCTKFKYAINTVQFQHYTITGPHHKKNQLISFCYWLVSIVMVALAVSGLISVFRIASSPQSCPENCCHIITLTSSNYHEHKHECCLFFKSRFRLSCCNSEVQLNWQFKQNSI